MIFWHLGGAIFLFRSIFRDPKVDLRYLAFGALLPDLLDLPLGRLLEPPTTEAFGHTLLLAVVYMTVVLLATSRGGDRRKMLLTIGIGWLFHLLLDGLWLEATVLFWPLAGTTFPPTPPLSGAVGRALADPWWWLREVAGLAYLLVLMNRHHLTQTDRRRAFLASGRLQ